MYRFAVVVVVVVVVFFLFFVLLLFLVCGEAHMYSMHRYAVCCTSFSLSLNAVDVVQHVIMGFRFCLWHRLCVCVCRAAIRMHYVD